MIDDDPVLRLKEALQGRYEILRELGEGGMAMVYLVRDEKHNRNVALKVLKPDLAAAVGAERFLAEIETTANLQHPDILPLFDSGEANGLLYYVMPFVEGESLRERLDREHQLPVEEATGIAKTVAEALDYAHRAGVIHRDIKPANVLLVEGKPVLSDFGIAMAAGAARSEGLTEAGSSLGTPRYMSPEQATGESYVGPSTDVYSLGCVLYEMLTGEPPFTGTTPQAVLGRIVTTVPDPVTAHRRTVPPNVESAIERALEKVPADRFARASDFARALDDPGFRHGRTERETAARGVAFWKPAAVIASALAVAFAATAGWMAQRNGSPRSVQRFPLALALDARALSIMPDGSGIVFSEGGQLQVRLWEDAQTIPVAGATGELFEYTSDVSPDGADVAFVVDGTLRVASLAGGRARELAGSAYCCPTWSKDGFVYYSDAARSIRRVRSSGGAPEMVLQRDLDHEAALLHFRPLPEEGIALLTVMRGGDFVIEAQRLSTGQRTAVTSGMRADLTPTGHLVFASSEGRILAAGLDLEALQLTSDPISLVDDLLVANDVPMFDLSPDGDLIYHSGSPTAGTHEFVWLSRDGTVSPAHEALRFIPNTPGGQNLGWAISPEGDRVAFQRMDNGNVDIWVVELPAASPTRLTYHPNSDILPGWLPDGSRVTFSASRNVADGNGDHLVWSLSSARPDGTGEPELILAHDRVGGSGVLQHDWSPGAQSVVLRSGGPEPDLFIGRFGAEGVEIDTLLATPFAELAPVVSPDGRWLAYESNEGNRQEIHIRPFPEAGSRRWVMGAGNSPRWSRDGGEVYFVDFERREMRAAAFRSTGADPRPGPVVTLFAIPPSIVLQPRGMGRLFDVDRDGRFLMLRETEVVQPSEPVVLVRNLFHELERREGP